MPVCKKCGYNNKEGNNYCVNCGAVIELTEAEVRRTKEKERNIVMSRFFIYIGMFFLLGAGCTIYAAVSTSWMYRGTILENDPNIRQITNNYFTWGILELIIGLIFIVLFVARSGAKQSHLTDNNVS